jgi:hypothetical protein
LNLLVSLSNTGFSNTMLIVLADGMLARRFICESAYQQLLDGRFGSLQVAEYTLCEGLVSEVKQSLDSEVSKTAILNVSFHQNQTFDLASDSR